MHSAAWDNSYDLQGKRVAVIGGGSSAVQIVPSIQPCEFASGVELALLLTITSCQKALCFLAFSCMGHDRVCRQIRRPWRHQFQM